MAGRRCVNRRIVSRVDHILADDDEVATDRQVVDGAAVILGVDNCSRLGGKARKILIEREPGDVKIRRQEGLERHRSCKLAGPDQTGCELENALVNRLEEVLVLKEVRNAIKRLVIDQDSAQQSLFGLDMVRRRAELGFRSDLFACNRIDWCHGPDQEIRVWLFWEHSTSRTTQRQRHYSSPSSAAATTRPVDSRPA